MLLIGLPVLGGYAAYQRIGTTANADLVEFTRNLAGGFVAVGMTDEQPGFIVISALDQDLVEVAADQWSNRLAGTHTIVEIQTPHQHWTTRLRRPQVIMVYQDGVVEGGGVDWTVADFNGIREAVDCSFEAASKKRRCGRPFADLHQAFAGWAVERVPEPVRAFLTPFADRPVHPAPKPATRASTGLPQ